MQYIQNLVYKPTIQNSEYVARVDLSGADPNFTIKTTGSVDGQPNNVDPNYFTIDNLTNNKNVTVSFGPFQNLVVPAYSRKTFKLPQPTQTVVISFLTTALTVYFVYSQNYAIDDQNFLAIQQAARGVALFPWVLYNAANSPQQTTDANCVIELLGVGFQITYTLLSIAVAANNVQNGWFQFLFNNGNRAALILPFGADTINGIFNNATPYILFPGEFGTLHSDGTQWFFKVFGGRRASSTRGPAVWTQGPADITRRLVFNGVAGSTYNLLPSATFVNGDWVRCKNLSTGVLQIKPNGAESIGNTFTTAAPLNLYPGDEVELYIDDSGAWQVSGTITWQSADMQFGESFSANTLHGMGGVPDNATAWVRCLNAEINYIAGDIFKLGVGTASTTTNGGENVINPNATGVFWTISPNAGIRLPNKTTAASSNVATTGAPPHLTNFSLFFTASRKL